MISLMLRYFFIFSCGIYCYLKILNINTKSVIFLITNIVSSFGFALVLNFLPVENSALRFALLFSLLFIFTTFYTQTKLHISFTVTIISVAISVISLAFSSLIFSISVTMLLTSILPTGPSLMLLMGLMQLLLPFLLFKIKRLKKGMPFLYQNFIINLGIIIAIPVILIFLLLQHTKPSSFSSRLLVLFFILLLALALLIWWRRKITQSYVEKLRVSEVEALYKEISDKEHEIEKLHSNNRYLARIIHKDNKLIPAMELAVRNYLQNGMQMKPEDARQYGIDLLAQLQTMAADREGIIQNYHDDYRFRPQIGLYSVDAIIYYMERRAIPHSIRYEYQFDKGLKEVMLSYIDENDAIHLLSDAIENSIIATMHVIKKEIKIHIGFIQDILFMDISDTGLPFEPATYQNFGLLQHTTHKDSGGSGVGLLDIWKLKHKYKISLQIYEYPPDDHEYTKKIRFFFDRRNHFLIQSYRSQEITSLITRSDLHVFPYVEGSDFILTLDEEITEETE